MDLLLLAEDDPTRAMDLARNEARRAAADADLPAEIDARRAVAVCERGLGRPRRALRELDRALARVGGDRRLGALVRISRAACFMSLGDEGAATRDVNEALRTLTGVDRAVALFQRASIVARFHGPDAAAPELDRAIPLLRRGGARLYEAHALNNRGLMRTYAGRFNAAQKDLERARALYLELGTRESAATALHNLAFLATSRGDVIGALEQFEQARREFLEIGAGVAALDLDWCRALLAAGLAREARERAVAAVTALRAAHNRLELPEAQLVAALCCVQSHEYDEARTWARAAEQRFTTLRRMGWADLAALVRLSCPTGRRARPTAAAELAGRLDRDGLPVPATQARLLTADLLLRAGNVAEARTVMASVTRRWLTPDLRIGMAEVAARVAEASGDERACTAWLRRGVQELHRVQDDVASAEVRWGIAVHARDLLSTGRDRALRRGSVANWFRWVELARANALRHAPLERPSDPRLDELLTHLRAVTYELQESTDPVAARHLMSRQLLLQRAVAERERVLRPHVARVAPRVIGIEELRTALGGRVLVELEISGDRLLALRIDGRRSEIVDVGPVAPIQAMFSATALVLNRLAASGGSERAWRSASTRLQSLSSELDARLGPGCTGDVEKVIVPPGALHAAPWAFVPSVGRAAFTIVASATTWAAEPSPPRSSPRAVLVAGAGLEHADAEVRAIAAVHGSPTTFTTGEATAPSVCDAIDGAWLAHFATHHQHRRENPLFGSLELADGPLLLHDLLRVNALPSIVVLSACEAAQGDAGPVGDVLGAASVMMERGTASVIASPNLVADTAATSSTMVDLHRRLAAGVRPAIALHELRRRAAEDDDAPSTARVGAYSCFGIG